MTKKIFLMPLLFLTAFSITPENKSLSGKLKDSYKSAFYPGVVRYAEEILKTEKDSLASFRAAVYCGESLFRMGRMEDSLKMLQSHSLNGDSLNSETIILNSAKFYWLGRIYFFQENYPLAQSNFYASAAVFKEIDEKSKSQLTSREDYYALSMLYGGRSYFAREKPAKAVPLFEYVVSQGQKYSPSDFEDTALKLAQSYIKAGKSGQSASSKYYSRCIDLVTSLENAPFDEETKYSLLILKGQALEESKEYLQAYTLYCAVIEKAPPQLSASAMQKAYLVSSAHKAQVGSEPGSVISRAEGRLSEYPDLLSEFWTRLAVDAYNETEYQKSLSYFEEAQVNASDSQKKIAAIYKAQIAWESSSDKNQGCNEAVSILEKEYKNPSKKEKILSENVTILLARYKGYLADWKSCEKYAKECLSSADEEIQKNAYYWLALSKYKSGKYQEGVDVLKNYQGKDPSILNLYAKSLAKTGKYHEADLIFYDLGEKNQLDNDGHLDYTRTLLIAGHYSSTKAQAAKASGDESIYLSALASFNQGRWQEAEEGFTKILSSKKLHSDYVAYALFYTGYAQYQRGDWNKSLASLKKFISAYPLHKFSWSASMTMARAAASGKNQGEALASAEQALKSASSEKEKEEAVILYAGILSDGKDYDAALALLAPYISRRNEFGWECKYRSAELFLQKNDFSQSDKYFAELAALPDKNAALIAEESAYRRAELAYSREDFAKSAQLFEEYSRKWPSGRFFWASVYFSADSLAKNSSQTRAILRYLQIVDSNAQTSYRYGSEKNLVDLYENAGEYENAIAMAKKMIDEYSSQAIDDGMAKKIKELESKSGKKVQSLDSQIAQAEKNLQSQKNDPEQSAQAAKNAIFLAAAYRNQGQKKKSAQMYLDGVKYARQAGNDQEAQRAFYGAVESFDAAGLYGDAEATFTEMKKLYPDSDYTKEGEKLVRNQ